MNTKKPLPVPATALARIRANSQSSARSAISRVLSRVDSTLLGRPVQTTTAGSEHITYGSLRRMSSDPTQVINLAFLFRTGDAEDDFINMLAQNYHALGHKIFTPYKFMTDMVSVSTPLTVALTDLEKVAIFIECARVERYMIAAYPITRSYFTNLTFDRVRIIMKDPSIDNRMAAYLYLAARPYIGGPLRLSALAGVQADGFYPGVKDPKVKEAFHKYVAMPFSSAEKDLKPSHDALSTLMFDLTDALGDSDNFRRIVPLLSGAPSPCRLSQSDGDTTLPPFDMPDLEKKSKAQDKNDDDDDGSSKDDGKSESENDSSQNNGDKFQAELEEAAQQAEDVLLADGEASSDVKDLRTAVQAAGAYISQQSAPTLVIPTDEYVALSKRLTREFSAIVAENDPGMNKYHSSGRVNLSRAMGDIDYETVFDRWDEGKTDVSSLEVVTLLDRSSSMGSSAAEVFQANWALTRAIEALGPSAAVTCIAYESECNLIKHPKDRIGPKVPTLSADGGTAPYTGLCDAQQIFARSKRAKKLLLILTDGSWGDAKEPDALIAHLQSTGVHVALAYLTTSFSLAFGITVTEDRFHGADTRTKINKPIDYAEMARGVVKGVMKQ